MLARSSMLHSVVFQQGLSIITDFYLKFNAKRIYTFRPHFFSGFSELNWLGFMPGNIIGIIGICICWSPSMPGI
jgi:hypothetical protein